MTSAMRRSGLQSSTYRPRPLSRVRISARLGG
jgi:hypothetical protein